MTVSSGTHLLCGLGNLESIIDWSETETSVRSEYDEKAQYYWIYLGNGKRIKELSTTKKKFLQYGIMCIICIMSVLTAHNAILQTFFY